MTITRLASWTLVAGLAAIPCVLGQVAPPDNQGASGFGKFSQPWTPPAAAHRSRVEDCVNPVPMDRVCYDDFGFKVSGFAVRLHWWGVLMNQGQVNRPYYIAIYSDQNCQPQNLLYEACVVPQVQFKGVDCANKNVFTFRTAIPAFPVTAGQRYWLQISEDDANSAQVGQDDFGWSGRQPVRFCSALQSNGNGEFMELVDACNQATDDLSFEVTLWVP